MQKKLESYIYESEPSTIKGYPPRFANQKRIQDCLKNLCETWVEYLQHYTERTNDLFGKTECAWSSTERAIVSTLAASIMREFRSSIVLEESRVLKPGNVASDRGRCDLWASIPELTSDVPIFNFYLEAKKSRQPKSYEALKPHLLSKYGISKLFRDFKKGHLKKLTDRSPFRNDRDRKHEHYVIGLLVTPLASKERDINGIKEKLVSVFENSHKLFVRPEEAGMDFLNDRRHIARYPTVALILVDPNDKHPGMIASFTVLASTNRLLASGTAKPKSK